MRRREKNSRQTLSVGSLCLTNAIVTYYYHQRSCEKTLELHNFFFRYYYRFLRARTRTHRARIGGRGGRGLVSRI